MGRPTEAEARIKREQILGVAQELFVEFGYSAVSMRLVAERAQVSTRTLYNQYADKATLFAACLDFGAAEFPRLEAAAGTDVRGALQGYAAGIVRILSRDRSFRLGTLIYREGGDFPELLRASEGNYERYLVQPLAAFLGEVGLATNRAEEHARLFIMMALSEWQRRIVYRRPPLKEVEIERHARFAVGVFLDGVVSG
jgi:AcrR family transcriptional regulator